MDNTTLKKVAEQVGVSVETLEQRMNMVRIEQGSQWEASGYDEEKVNNLVLRISARQLHSEQTKIKSSGATLLEGMFILSPRYKDWGKLRYDKMTSDLKTMGENERNTLVSQGIIVYYENNHDGSWTRHMNDSLRSKQSFSNGSSEDVVSEPHKNSVQLDENTMYYMVADKNSPTFPSGDANWKYGMPAPQSDKKRTCKFVGRVADSNNDLEEYDIVYSGEMADASQPTFVPCTIAVRLGKNNTGWAKAGLTTVNPNPAIASIFPSPPVAWDNGKPVGMMVDSLGSRFLGGFADLGSYHASIPEDERWTSYCGLVAEVVHIDPRENGAFTITLGDLDILSSAPTVDIWVDASQSNLIDFGVGSQLAVFGSVWLSDNEPRFSCQSWYVVESVAALSNDLEDGWDE